MKKLFLVVTTSMFLVFFMTKNTTQAAVTLIDQTSSATVYGFNPAEYLRFSFSFTVLSDRDVFISDILFDAETLGSVPRFEGLTFTSAFPAEDGYIRLFQNTLTNLSFQGWLTVDKTCLAKVIVLGMNISEDKISSTEFLFDTPMETQTKLLTVIPELSSAALACLGLLGFLTRRSR